LKNIKLKRQFKYKSHIRKCRKFKFAGKKVVARGEEPNGSSAPITVFLALTEEGQLE
jgi:hypothetical protein